MLTPNPGQIPQGANEAKARHAPRDNWVVRYKGVLLVWIVVALVILLSGAFFMYKMLTSTSQLDS